MRFSLPLRLAALVAAGAAPVAAQPLLTSQRAFEPAVSPWIGLGGFGHRYTNSVVEAGFYSSVSMGLGADLPVTRRIGLLLNTEFAPRSAQRTKSDAATTQYERVTQLRADLSLGWRFKPRAPIYFFAGGGIHHSSKAAYPGFDGATTHPEATFGLGFDKARKSGSPWNFRMVFANHLVFPKAPDAGSFSGGTVAPQLDVHSTAYDWTVQLGARRSFGSFR
jgi:hypothetical protein